MAIVLIVIIYRKLYHLLENCICKHYNIYKHIMQLYIKIKKIFYFTFNISKYFSTKVTWK